jgi:hypothetical protein
MADLLSSMAIAAVLATAVVLWYRPQLVSVIVYHAIERWDDLRDPDWRR